MSTDKNIPQPYVQYVKATAVQILATDSDKESAKAYKHTPFMGGKLQYEQDGAGEDIGYFTHFSINGVDTKVYVGDWLVEYPDGKKAIFSDEDFHDQFESGDDVDELTHVVTQQDLDDNPDLAEKGVQVGQTISLGAIIHPVGGLGLAE